MTQKTVDVLGSEMAYVEEGEGDPIVLLHGNPTSSYLWRDVIPHLTGLGRCVAPDLIGMGRSAKVPGSSYRFVDHRRYLDAFLDAVGIHGRVTLVIHDWGSGLGFDWANRHRDAVRGIAFMEAIVRPLTWEEWPESARGVFQAMRSEAGEDLVLQRNLFVERVLPASILRDLPEETMDVYRAPFAEPGEDRRPTLTWPRELPIDGEPADVHQIVADYAEWLSDGPVPTLFINADPGSILIGRQREFVRSWPNQQEVTVPGAHFIQEDSGPQIGEAVADWLRALG